MTRHINDLYGLTISVVL